MLVSGERRWWLQWLLCKQTLGAFEDFKESFFDMLDRFWWKGFFFDFLLLQYLGL